MKMESGNTLSDYFFSKYIYDDEVRNVYSAFWGSDKSKGFASEFSSEYKC